MICNRQTYRLVVTLLLLGVGLVATVCAQEAARLTPVRLKALSPSAAKPSSEITVVTSDNRRLLIEYRPEFAPLRTIKGAGQDFLQVDFEGSAPFFGPNDAGSPDLRYRDLPVALPIEQGNAVRIVAADYEDLQGVDLAPVPRVRMRDDMVEPDAFERSPDRYAGSGFVPANGVELTSIGLTRSVLVGDLRVAPVQFDPASRTIRKYTRVLIELTYGAINGPRIAAEDQRMFQHVLLNAATARLWTGTPAKVQTHTAQSSVLAAGDWYRLTVTDEGVYRLDAQFLSAAGIPVSSVNPQTIKIYGNGGKEIPESPVAPRTQDLAELAVYVAGESDGTFDAGDYVLFYGKSVRGLTYDPAGRTLRHYLNHYTEENYYWLTFGGANGRRMSSKPSEAGPPAVTAERFLDEAYIEEEKMNKLSSGKDWCGQSIPGPSGAFTYVSALPNLVPNIPILYRYTLLSASDAQATFRVSEHGSQIGAHSIARVYGYVYANAGTFEVRATPSLPDQTSQLNFAYSSPGVASEGLIDWVEIVYPRMLWAVNGYLRFRSPDTTGVVEYMLQQFPVMPVIFDVTQHDSVQMVTGVEGSYMFRAREVGGKVSEYVAAGPSAWRTPAAVQKMSNQNLRGYADGADFIIVTSPEFRAAADRLREYRERSTADSIKAIVVDVNQIYNEFGGGIPDVTSIRDYLKYAYETWGRRPQFVLFLGGASYDYKGILGFKSSFVPTWQSAESRDDVESWATDDFFVKFTVSDRPSLVVGRISSRKLSEADAALEKIFRYEESSVQDTWKMRMLFIGDDAWTPEGGEIGDRTTHSQDAETLASNYTPDEFEKRKIYIAEYPTVNAAAGRRKPGAYQAIIDQINQGALITNYAGHGNPTVWAHERIFETGSSIPQLFNANRLCVFFLATCNFSQYDDPKLTSGGELLLNRLEGGAVAVVSAARKVYAGANAALNQGTYRNLFSRDAYGRVIVERPATALFLYKATVSNLKNDQKFFFLGDPAMRLQYPRRYASIDSINGVPVGTDPVQLRSLARVQMSGLIRDANNQPDPAFGGRATVSVNDANRKQTIVNFYPGYNWDYVAAGGTIYRGENSVANGRFAATFVVPKDVSYADSTARGRMVAYFSDGKTDGAGYTGSVRVGGADSGAVVDHQGPSIAIRVGSKNFQPGDMVDEKPMLYVDLADSSGINTSGSGIGHRIEAWINNSLQSTDLTDYYASKLDDFRAGTVQYQLRGLTPGKNTVRVRAWDSYNNSNVSDTYFTVASSDQLTIADVFNYPNPFADGTLFTFRTNASTPIDVTVKVYTVAGRLIQTVEGSFSGEPYVRLHWDGRDRDGDIIANGVYLYKVLVRTNDGGQSAEALGKLSVIR
jgi:hypothetical protein